MIDKETLDKYDKSGMYKVYDDWPSIAKNAFESNLKSINFDGIDHIVFCGMGGSGAIGDLFLSLLSKTPIYVTVVKGYLLPKTVSHNTLVVAISVSGNTIETITCVKSALEIDCKIICFSSGGYLEEFCKTNAIQHRNVLFHKNPRTSFPSYVYSILKVLISILPITEQRIWDSVSQLEKIAKKISTTNLSDTNPSLSLANWMDKIHLIYYPWGLRAPAIRFKNSIQENMKAHAMTEDVIEASHNGIVSWETPSAVKPILIQGSEDYIKTTERWSVLKKYFQDNDIDFWSVSSVGDDILSKIICLIYLLDFATIYKAVINKIDPFPVPSIDYMKNNLSHD